MALTKQQAKLVARDFAKAKPHISEHKDCELCSLWQKMVFAVANHGVPSNWANAFEWACHHSGMWPDHL